MDTGSDSMATPMVIDEVTSFCFWNTLPPEMRRTIVSFMGASELLAAAYVCVEFYEYSTDETLWEKLCKRDLGPDINKPVFRSWKWLYCCKTTQFLPGRGMRVGTRTDEKGTYEGEWFSDKFHGFGMFTWKDKVYYAGEFYEGLIHGQGKMVWPNGDIYVGGWKNEQKHGYGTFMWANGDKYVGEYENNKKSGFGVITWGTHPGESYSGQWKDDKKHGYGEYRWPNGGYYKGAWKDNKRHGQGSEVWSSGSIYEGSWMDDEMSGFGKKICTRDNQPDGTYEGEFKNGRANGKGFRVYIDGSTYNGEYKDDKRVGLGVFTWPNGDQFIGEWKVGRWQGTFRSKDGQIVQHQEWHELEFDKGNKGFS
mmetsp:Transcript_28343/g.40024  ORF Transcript_28343/g.40024 Transcript_28343/m.40024 type:complete len:365 (+) Transcript_28343:110-1204(+)